MKSLGSSSQNKRFYSLLIKLYLPLWILWQLCWHLAFRHIIDYQNTDVGLLVSAKLGMESVFFIGAAVLLLRHIKARSIVNTSILALFAGLGVYTLYQWLSLNKSLYISVV